MPGVAFAGSATWKTSPLTGNWNAAGNWTTGGPPNGPSDVATFATSNKTTVLLSADIEVSGITFNSGGSIFNITTSSPVLTISGSGITNNSTKTQLFFASPNASNGTQFCRRQFHWF